METILFTFGGFILIVLVMALGFIFKKRELKGSCGGMSALGISKMCDCDEPCDNLKAKIEKGEATEADFKPRFYDASK